MIVFLLNINSSFLHGATFIDKHKIVIGLPIMGKDADNFAKNILIPNDDF